MERLKKSDLINAVSEEHGITKADVTRVIDSLQSNIVQAVSEGKRVQMTGFATFEPVQRSARVGRNPKTGERVDIPAKRSVKISPSQSFRDAVQ